MTAYGIAAAKGIDAVMARDLGKALGSTARPIFTVFSGMDELKDEVRILARKRCLEYLADSFNYHPAFKEFGMRWVKFAVEQPHLYALVFSSAGGPAAMKTIFGPLTEKVIESAIQSFDLNRERAEALMDQMIVFSNGIAAFSLRGGEVLSEAQLAKSVSEVCIGMVIRFQLLDGTFRPEAVRAMVEQPGFIPERITQ